MRKRLLTVALALVIALATAIALLAALVTGESARVRVEAELSRWLGARVEIGSEPGFFLRPAPGIRLVDVNLENSREGWAVRDARLMVDLDIVALLLGEVRISSATLEDARISVASLPADVDEAVSSAESTVASVARLLAHPLRIDRATLVLARRGVGEEVIARDLSLRLSASGTSANLRGALRVADQTVEINVALRDRSLLAGEGKSPFSLSLASQLATLRLDGEIGRVNKTWFGGTIEFQTSDLRGLGARFDWAMPGEAAFGALLMRGTGEISSAALSLPQARIEFDGNVGDGSLALDLGRSRPRLEGTLAFETFDASAYLAEVDDVSALLRDEARMGDPLAGLLQAMDIDLRLSTGRLAAGTLVAGPSAASILLREGDLSLDLGETQPDGGQFDLAARLKPGGEAGDYMASVSLVADPRPVAALPWPDPLPRPTAGVLGGRGAWKSTGRTLSELLSRGSGEARLSGRDLAFGSGGAEAVFAGLLGRTDAADAQAPSRFASVEASLSFAPERIEVTALEAETAAHRLEATGRIAPENGALSLRGGLRARKAAGDAPSLPVLLRGTLTHPLVVPDLTNMSERPGR
jgi:uncharacterized protein involved in outer membrane biogenesis